MVHVTKRTVSGKTYYYLEHTIREGSKVRKEEKYLGRSIPKDVEDMKKSFLAELCKTRWYPLLESIKENYSKEISKSLSR